MTLVHDMRWTSQKLARRLRLVEEMYHHRPDAQRLYRNSFIALEDYDETAYTAELEKLSATIEIKLREFVAEKHINFLIAENVWSVAVNPAVAPALARVMRDLNLPTVAHNHDFYWERVDGATLTCGTADPSAAKIALSWFWPGMHKMNLPGDICVN